MRRKVEILCFILLFSLSVFSQTNTISFESTGLVRNGSEMPFWFTHNQYGKYAEKTDYQLVNELQVSGTQVLKPGIQFEYGTDLVIRFDEDQSKLMIQQAYLKLKSNRLMLTMGSVADEELFEGLSSSNGDLVQSVNYRPYPRISLASNHFIALPVFNRKLSFSFLFEEAYLYDKRYIMHSRLHHDQLILRYRFPANFTVSAGMNRYVFWAGEEPDKTKLPSDLKSYFRYLFGTSGGSDFLETDQENAAGNTLGSYLLSIEKEFEHWHSEIRMSHPFEDHSGMEFANYRDNQYTLYLKQKRKGAVVEAIVFEYLYTKHQSGDKHQITGPKDEHMRGLDNYFNNSVYRSGYTFLSHSMGTPFFTPVNQANGISTGFANNRISAFHTGISGNLKVPSLKWKVLLSYTRNFGTYASPYPHRLDQWYSLAELSWIHPYRKFQVSGKAGIDCGELSGDNAGVGLSFKKWF